MKRAWKSVPAEPGERETSGDACSEYVCCPPRLDRRVLLEGVSGTSTCPLGGGAPGKTQTFLPCRRVKRLFSLLLLPLPKQRHATRIRGRKAASQVELLFLKLGRLEVLKDFKQLETKQYE